MTTSNPTVWLTLQAHDASKLIDYYVDTFGFVVTARYGDGDVVDHAQLNWPEGVGGIMLGSHKPGNDWCREPGTAGGFIVTSDPDGLYRRVLEHKAEVIRPLTDTDYGAREFAVRDPEGNLWSFGDYAGAQWTGDSVFGRPDQSSAVGFDRLDRNPGVAGRGRESGSLRDRRAGRRRR